MREARQLLLFAYYFPPENTSGAHRPYRLARYLQSHDFHTHVITSSPQGDAVPWKHVTETTVQGASGMAKAGALAARALQRVLPYNDALPWVSDGMVAAERLIPSLRPDAMFSTSPPIAGHLAALFTKWRHSIPWVADFRDPFYANPLRPRKLSRPYEAVVERLIMGAADAVVANTDCAGETLRRRYPRFAKKIHVIWNGYDPADSLTARPIPERGRKVLLHAGSLYAGRHPSALMSSMWRLIERGRLDPARICLRLVGWMDIKDPWIAEPACAALGEKGCLECLNEMIPEPQALREMTEADYLLLLDINNTGASVQVPAKIFQYVRIGRPILAFTSTDSPSHRILAHSGIPHVAIAPGTAEEMVDAGVSAFFDLPSDATPPSGWFEAQFNARTQAEALAAILNDIA